ncbi:MAG: hypothetical protein NTX59_14300 [Elusimicrobia bacterium]|nr:hypothetical protein [Elusimicrobiota bacterium]
MKKIYELGSKTGLNAGELNKLAKFGILGLAALAFASLAACFKDNKTELKPAQPSAQAQPTNLQELANSVNTSTAPARPKDRGDGSQNCGPYPGYPCGTKYYTVSVSDFKA